MDTPFSEEYRRIERLLIDTNDQLLGLHRYGALTYPQYAALANPLVDIQQNLKRMLRGEAIDETFQESGITLPIPL